MNFKKITSILSAAAVLCGTAFAADFTDVSDTHWAAESIDDMAYKGILDGYDDGTFLPENQMTRAEFAAILCRAAGLWSLDAPAYTDVSEGDWFYEYVAGAADCFDAADSFDPNTPITRLDAAKAIVRALGYTETDEAQSAELQFTDTAELDTASKALLARAVSTGIIDGFDDGTFRPADTLTRAQAAVMAERGIDTSIVIKIDDTKIFSRELTDLCYDIYGDASSNSRIVLANNLISVFVGERAAKQSGITPADEDIADVDNVVSEMCASGCASTPDFLNSFYTAAAYFNKYYSDYTSKLELTDAEVNEEYTESYYRAKHILVADEATANDLLAQAKNGADFDELILNNSTDPGSFTFTDGYIFTDGEMVSEFEECVKSLEPGEFGICQSDYGWHVVERLDLVNSAAGYGNTLDMVKKNMLDTAFSAMLSEYSTNVDIVVDWESVSAVG